MRLPNADRAVVELAKLREYCLSAQHPVGRHKAKVFASALGIAAHDAELLQTWLLEAAFKHEAQSGMKDGFGQRYTLDFPAAHGGRSATIRSCWIVLADEVFPRLTTCYVV